MFQSLLELLPGLGSSNQELQPVSAQQPEAQVKRGALNQTSSHPVCILADGEQVLAWVGAGPTGVAECMRSGVQSSLKLGCLTHSNREYV